MRLVFHFIVILSACLHAQSISITPGVEIAPVVAPSIRLEFETIGDRYYQIESSRDLAVWKNEGYAFQGNGRRMAAMVSNHGLPRLFYRVRNNANASDLPPVNPYGGFVSPNLSPILPAPLPVMTASGFNPVNHRLMVVDSSSGGQTLREISIAELRKVPGMAIQWGEIAGTLANQPDLHAALGGKFSASNPPGWSIITNKPTNLLGYGITDAVSTSTVGLMDRFSRYPEGAVIVNNKTLPEVGYAWRFNITGKNRFSLNTISVSAADSSFNDSANGFLANKTAVGDVYVVTGFAKAANNGRFRVASVTAGKITVTSETGGPVTLADEPAGPGRNFQGAYPPYVSGGALRAADHSLIYLGAPTPTRNGRFSITFEVELKPSIHPTGGFGAALTIGIDSSQLIPAQGGLYPDNYIHCQLYESGVRTNDIFRPNSPIATDQGPNPIPFKAGVTAPKNTKFLINITVEGDEMRISALGGTIIYRDARLPAYIGDPDTHWFYEVAGDTLGTTKYANVYHLHRVWVNAAELDRTEGWGIPSLSPGGIGDAEPTTSDMTITTPAKSGTMAVVPAFPNQAAAISAGLGSGDNYWNTTTGSLKTIIP
jgi:hypothetical protein